MLTNRNVQQLQLQFANELNASLRTVVGCALLLLLLVGVAWLGAVPENTSVSIHAEN